jgi:CHAD domain-containing protein
VPHAPVELLLPASVDPAQAIELLSERLELQLGRPGTQDRLLLDSFDGRLRDAGLRAEAVGGELVVHEPGAPVRRAEVRRARRYLAAELPAGVAKERVAEVLGPRALLPRARVRSTVQPMAVLDGDAKTVARLTIERSVVMDGDGRTELTPRLEIRPVLGYDKAFERTVVLARDRLGFAPAEHSLYDAAVRATGGRPSGIKSKPQVELPGDTRADEAARIVLNALADIAEINLPGAVDDLDSEFLHDLRVSIRRARSVLRELKGVHPPEARAQVREELKWAQGLTGPVRDLDVQLLEWDALAASLATARAAELAALRDVLERRRGSERAGLRRALRSNRFAAALRGWRELADTPPPAGEDPERPDAATPIAALAGARIRKVYRRMVRDGTAIDDASPPEALHDLRKRGKELRYLLELFGDAYPKTVVKPMISTLKGLQDVLGRFQDRATQIGFLRGLADELATEPGGPAALLALGSVLDAVEADQREARAEFPDAFAPFAAGNRARVVRDTFPKRA